jgi:hypothetical protein
MVASRISRQGRGLVAPLDQFSLELLQQDIDAVYMLLINGISSDYMDRSFLSGLDSEICSGSIRPQQEYLVGKMEGPT